MNEPATSMKERLFFLFCFLLVIFAALGARLGYIQIYMHESYSEMAQNQQTRSIALPATRGEITDRKGEKLAFSIRSYSVWADTTLLKDREETARQLAGFLEIPEADIMTVLQDKKQYVRIGKEKLGQDTALQIKELKLKGISVEETVKRVYPKENMAAHILGLTTDDSKGLAGIELTYEKELSGEPGKLVIRADAYGRQLPNGSKEIIPPKNGRTVELTIDEIIQHYTEKALDAAMIRTEATGMVAVMMDVRTGEILAMASRPDYNPNQPRVPLNPLDIPLLEAMDDPAKVEYWNEMWKNRVVNSLYEPGSTFKLIAGAAAMDAGAITLNSTFNCPGYEIVDGVKIKCWSKVPHGHQNFFEATQNSCNPAFIQIGMRLGKDNFFEYLKKFNINKKTGIELPGESAPLLRPLEDTVNVDYARMTFGYSVSVTPLRMVTALGVLGNKGQLMTPHIVKSIRDDQGKVILSTAPKPVGSVLSEATAADMLKVMESVVTEGSGKKAYVPGYRIGGKTGTANKLIDGRYSPDHVYSSFAAIAPLDNPRLALLVVVDEPKANNIHFGSLVAAPIAHEILRDTLGYLEIPPQFEGTVKEVVIPDLKGKSLDEARKLLTERKLEFVLPDNLLDESILMVSDQYPKAGEKVYETTRVILYPARRDAAAE